MPQRRSAPSWVDPEGDKASIDSLLPHPFLISWAAHGESTEKAPLFGETVPVANSSDDHERLQRLE